MPWPRLAAGSLLLLLAFDPLAAQEKKARQPQKDQRGPFNAARMLEQLDKNKDGYLDRSEVPERMRERFERMDADKDGKLSRAELGQIAQRVGQAPAARPGAGDPDLLFRLLDADNDGKLSRDELQNAPRLLEKLDRNKNGVIERDELTPPGRPGGGKPREKAPEPSGAPAREINTPPAKGERLPDTLQVGDPAPDFALPLVKGKGEITLSSYKGKKPVVLIFGSYT